MIRFCVRFRAALIAAITAAVGLLGTGVAVLATAQVAWAASPVAAASSSPAWTAYVSEAPNTLTPINTATNTPGTRITTGMSPYGIAITPDAKTAYAANALANTVVPVSTATNTVGTAIPVGAFPYNIAITPDGTTAYVTNYNGGTVTPINLATNTAGMAIRVGAASGSATPGRPTGIAITPDGKTAYVTNKGLNTVTPITVATNTVGTPIPVGVGPNSIAITPDGKTAYVTNNGSDTVTPITLATNTAGTPIPVGVGPSAVAITPNGQAAFVVYLSNHGTGGPGNGVAGTTVTPIDTSTNTAGPTVTVGAFPFGIAITPDSKTAYVVNDGSASVSPINIATNTVGTAIRVGNGPAFIAITPDQAPVARLSVTPAGVGSPTSFNASASTVTYGTIASYAWQFGDGTTATTTTPTTTHTYTSAGTFTASVTETSSGGTSTTQVFTGQTMSRNGGPQAIASATVTVGQSTGVAPAITSPATTTFTVGQPGSFTVTTTGTPTPSLSMQTLLPAGVTFHDNGNGTGTLSGTPAGGTGGRVYTRIITASNGVNPNATQTFVLDVKNAVPAAITSAATTSFTVGQPGSFTVTTTGTPTPSLSMQTLLPAGVTFHDNGNGTATLSGTPAGGTGGRVYTRIITASNGVNSASTGVNPAANGVNPATQTFVLDVRNST